MKNNTIYKKTAVIIAILLVVPLNINIQSDEAMAEELDNDYRYIWREAENWDRSYDLNSWKHWEIKTSFTASNNKYTANIEDNTYGDYVEWDFDVFESGAFYFYIRGFVSEQASSDVSLYWRYNNSDNGQIISTENWKENQVNSWKWIKYSIAGTHYNIQSGIGSLRLISVSPGEIKIDKILITDNPNIFLDDDYPGDNEGSNVHNIGAFPDQQGGEQISVNMDFVNESIESLSNVIYNVNWSQSYDIPKGRAYGSLGEQFATGYIYNLMKERIYIHQENM